MFKLSTKIFGFNNVQQQHHHQNHLHHQQQIITTTNDAQQTNYTINNNDDDLDTLDFNIDELDQAMLDLNNGETYADLNNASGVGGSCNPKKNEKLMYDSVTAAVTSFVAAADDVKNGLLNKDNTTTTATITTTTTEIGDVDTFILEKTHLVEFCTENYGQYFCKSWIDTFKNYKMIQIITELTSTDTFSQYISVFLSMFNIGTRYNFEFVELTEASIFGIDKSNNNADTDDVNDDGDIETLLDDDNEDLNSEVFDNIKNRLTKIIEDLQMCKSLSNLNAINSEFELIKNEMKNLFEMQQIKSETKLHENLNNKFNQLISNYISKMETASNSNKKKSVIFYFKHNNYQTWILPTDILNVYHMSIMPKQKSTFKRRLVCPINTTYASSKIFSHHNNDMCKSTNNYFKYLKSYFSLEYKFNNNINNSNNNNNYNGRHYRRNHKKPYYIDNRNMNYC